MAWKTSLPATGGRLGRAKLLAAICTSCSEIGIRAITRTPLDSCGLTHTPPARRTQHCLGPPTLLMERPFGLSRGNGSPNMPRASMNHRSQLTFISSEVGWPGGGGPPSCIAGPRRPAGYVRSTMYYVCCCCRRQFASVQVRLPPSRKQKRKWGWGFNLQDASEDAASREPSARLAPRPWAGEPGSPWLVPG